MKRLTSLGNGLKGLSAVSAGLMIATAFTSACGEGEQAPREPAAGEEFGVNLDALGTPITSCTAANTSSEYTAASKTLALTVTTGVDAVVSVVNGRLKVNGHPCATADGLALTTTNVSKLNIGAAGTSNVVIDMLSGSFGSMFSGTGGITVTGNAALRFGIRGNASPNSMKMAQEGSVATGPFYFELSNDTRADVKLTGDPAAITIALGEGNDSFTAQGQALNTSALGGSGTTTSVSTENLTVYGGGGIDTLKGGLGDDTLDGGDGNDIFTMSADNVDDGADTYIGGDGTDTVDYSGRTAALAVSIAPTHTRAWVEGVNIFNLTVPATQVLTYAVNGGGNTDITFPGTPTIGAADILTFLNGATGFNGAAVASVNDRGELVVVSAGAGELDIVASTAATTLFGGAKSNDGDADLPVDADDGLASEADDVRADVENITGGKGDDTLTGSIVSNVINGGDGVDNISGGIAGADCDDDKDSLIGGAGNDVFIMGFASNCGDSVDGGADSDVANYEMRTAGVFVDIDSSADDGESGESDTIKTTVEGVYGGEGNDTLTGGASADMLRGGLGADLISGGAGADTLVGGEGNDTLLGGTGEDVFIEQDIADPVYVKTIVMGGGADVINGGTSSTDIDFADYSRTATTALTATLCLDTSTSTAAGTCDSNPAGNDPDGDDISNVEHFKAGAGDDTITGSTGNDIIEGGAGADSIMGGEGNDELFGDADDDELFGEAGDDTLDGGDGTNALDGGDNEDVCNRGAAPNTDCEIE